MKDYILNLHKEFNKKFTQFKSIEDFIKFKSNFYKTTFKFNDDLALKFTLYDLPLSICKDIILNGGYESINQAVRVSKLLPTELDQDDDIQIIEREKDDLLNSINQQSNEIFLDPLDVLLKKKISENDFEINNQVKNKRKGPGKKSTFQLIKDNVSDELMDCNLDDPVEMRENIKKIKNITHKASRRLSAFTLSLQNVISSAFPKTCNYTSKTLSIYLGMTLMALYYFSDEDSFFINGIRLKSDCDELERRFNQRAVREEGFRKGVETRRKNIEKMFRERLERFN